MSTSSSSYSFCFFNASARSFFRSASNCLAIFLPTALAFFRTLLNHLRNSACSAGDLRNRSRELGCGLGGTTSLEHFFTGGGASHSKSLHSLSRSAGRQSPPGRFGDVRLRSMVSYH